VPDRHILIVDDELPIRQTIAFTLRRRDFEVAEAEGVEAARRCLGARRPDLLLLDWLMPGSSGIDLLQGLRGNRRMRTLPIIMLSDLAEEDAKVAALDAGADDYVTKPFSPNELVARINAVLRRATAREQKPLAQQEQLKLHRAQSRVQAGDREISLAPLDFRLLDYFVAHPERVHTRSQLLAKVWDGEATDERTVDVQIKRLRTALASLQLDGFVQTVRGAGYRFSTRAS
jgi:two-component system, OmpR family, phosphate regulon response regulator PhoB